MIKDVGEFKLVEVWFPGGPIIVEYSKEIRAALTKARFRISEARDGDHASRARQLGRRAL